MAEMIDRDIKPEKIDLDALEREIADCATWLPGISLPLDAIAGLTDWLGTTSALIRRIRELEAALVEACDLANEGLAEMIRDHPVTILDKDRVCEIRALLAKGTTR